MYGFQMLFRAIRINHLIIQVRLTLLHTRQDYLHTALEGDWPSQNIPENHPFFLITNAEISDARGVRSTCQKPVMRSNMI